MANAYEKQGTYTNTCGDVQMLKKAGDFAGVRTDFECIVRIALRMGYDVHKEDDIMSSYITALYFTTSSLTSGRRSQRAFNSPPYGHTATLLKLLSVYQWEICLF